MRFKSHREREVRLLLDPKTSADSFKKFMGQANSGHLLSVAVTDNVLLLFLPPWVDLPKARGSSENNGSWETRICVLDLPLTGWVTLGKFCFLAPQRSQLLKGTGR